MSKTIDEIIKLAKSYKGTQEKANNWNIFAEYVDKNFHPDKKYNENFYNTKKQNAPWCDVFHDFLYLKLFNDSQLVRKILCQPVASCGAGCSYSVQYYKEAKRFSNEAKVGAQIFFKGNKGTPVHTGIVIAVTAEKVTTIEGNAGAPGAVRQKSYSKKSNKIYGYGFPKWELGDAFFIAAEHKAEAEAEAAEKEKAETKANAAPVSTPTPTPTSTSTPASTPAKYTEYVVTAKSGLNIRKLPSKNSLKVGCLKYGATVKVASIKDSWAKLSTGNYVCATYIKKK